MSSNNDSATTTTTATVLSTAAAPLTIRVLYQVHPRIFDGGGNGGNGGYGGSGGGEQEIAFTVDLHEVVLRSKTNKYSVTAEHLLERLLAVFARSRHCQGYAMPGDRDQFLRELCVLRCLSIGTPLVELDVSRGERRVEFRQTDCVRLIRRYVIAPIYITRNLYVETRLDIRWNSERATDHVMRQLFDGNGFFLSTDYAICLTTHVSALWSEQRGGGNGSIDWIGHGVQIPSAFWSSSNSTLRKRTVTGGSSGGGGQQKSSLFGRRGGGGGSDGESTSIAANKWCWFDDLYTAVYEIDSKLWKSMYLRKRYFNLTNESYLLSLDVARKSPWDSFDLYNDVYECRQTVRQIAADYCGRNRDDRNLDNCVRRLVQSVSSESTSVYPPMVQPRTPKPGKVNVPTRMFDKQLRVNQLLKNVDKYLDGVNVSLRNGGRLYVSLPPSFRTFAKHLFDIRLSRFRLMSPVRIGPDSFLPIALCNLKVLFVRVERLDGSVVGASLASRAAAKPSRSGNRAGTAAAAAVHYNSYRIKANFERSRLLPHAVAGQLTDNNDEDGQYWQRNGGATLIVTVLLDDYINWRRDETLLSSSGLGSPLGSSSSTASLGLLGTARRRIIRLGGGGKAGSSDSLLSSSSSAPSTPKASPYQSPLPSRAAATAGTSAATLAIASAFNVFRYFVVDAYHLNEENCRRQLRNSSKLSACTAISIRDKSLNSLMINGVGVRALVKLLKHANAYAKNTAEEEGRDSSTSTSTSIGSYGGVAVAADSETYESIDVEVDAKTAVGAVGTFRSPKPPPMPPIPPPKPRVQQAADTVQSPIYEVPQNNGSVTAVDAAVGGAMLSSSSSLSSGAVAAAAGATAAAGTPSPPSQSLSPSSSVLRDLTIHYNNLHYIDRLLRQTTAEKEGLPFFGRLKSLHDNLHLRANSREPIAARELETVLDLVQSIYRHIPYIMQQLILLGYYSTHEKIEKLL